MTVSQTLGFCFFSKWYRIPFLLLLLKDYCFSPWWTMTWQLKDCIMLHCPLSFHLFTRLSALVCAINSSLGLLGPFTDIFSFIFWHLTHFVFSCSFSLSGAIFRSIFGDFHSVLSLASKHFPLRILPSEIFLCSFIPAIYGALLSRLLCLQVK